MIGRIASVITFGLLLSSAAHAKVLPWDVKFTVIKVEVERYDAVNAFSGDWRRAGPLVYDQTLKAQPGRAVIGIFVTVKPELDDPAGPDVMGLLSKHISLTDGATTCKPLGFWQYYGALLPDDL